MASEWWNAYYKKNNSRSQEWKYCNEVLISNFDPEGLFDHGAITHF